MPKSGEFEDGKKRLEAQVDAMAKTLDEIQLFGKEGGSAAKPISEADLMTFAKRNDDRNQQLIGIRHYRRLLCEDNNPHVQKIIEMGLVPFFVEALKADDCQLLQLEAAWALTNVSAGTCEETRVVIENGALPLLVSFTSKQSIDLKEQALWAIGNIAAEKSFLRALVGKGALDKVLLILETERTNLRLARIAVWALANFCRYGAEAVGIASDYIPRIGCTLCMLMKHSDRHVLSDTAWAIASFTTAEWTSSTKNVLVENGVLRTLAETLIETDRPTLQYPILKASAQILSGPEAYAVEFLSYEEVIVKLKKLLTTRINRKTLSNVLWLLQNIAGNKFRVASKIFSSGIVPRIVDLVIHGPFEIKAEAGSVLNNLFYITDLPVRGMDALIGADAIRALCVMLTWENKKTVIDTLIALDKALLESGKPTAQKHYNLSTPDEAYGFNGASSKDKKRVRVKHQGTSVTRFNAVAQRICNAGGKLTLLLLSDNEDRQVKQLAISILSTYFDAEDLSSPFSSDEEEADEGSYADMVDENGEHIEDAASELSVGARDEMALCEDMHKGINLWDGTAATSTSLE